MFLKKLGLSKKQTDALTIATGIFILGILLIISMMVFNNDPSDIDLFGNVFKVTEKGVIISSPLEENNVTVQVTEENHYNIEIIGSMMKKAQASWMAVLRNSLIFFYLLAILIIIFKNKETHFQGITKGFLIGVCLLLLLLILQRIMDVRSLLITFDHDYTHLFQF